jgi:hypothetical protein
LGDAVEACEAGDAVCAFGVEGLVVMVVREVAAVAVFDRDGG